MTAGSASLSGNEPELSSGNRSEITGREPTLGREAAFGQLIIALASKQSDTRQEALAELLKLGQPVIPTVRHLLTSHNRPTMRRAAAAALGQMGGQDDVPALLAALHDPNASVRWGAAWALGEAGARIENTELRAEIAHGLTQALYDRHTQTYRWALDALARLGESGIAGLIAGLCHSKPIVRDYATQRLYEAGAAAVPEVLGTLRHRDRKVRIACVKILVHTGRQSRDEALRQQIVDGLMRVIRDRTNSVRWFAIDAVGVMGDTRAVPVLIAGLRRKRVEVYVRTAEALGRLRDPRAVPVLIEMLDFVSPAMKQPAMRVQSSAVRALGEIGPAAAEAAPRLFDIMTSDPSQWMRDAAHEALPQIVPDQLDKIRVFRFLSTEGPEW
jgi:HEAT repeat protein